LVNLPHHIIETICKYLMQSIMQYPEIGKRYCGHRDILNLRRTCSALYRIVNACRLEFSLYIDLAWFEFANPSKCDFRVRCISHILDNTCWGIVRLICICSIRREMLGGSSQNESLFNPFPTTNTIANFFKSERIDFPFLKRVEINFRDRVTLNLFMCDFIEALIANPNNGKFEVKIICVLPMLADFNRCIPETTALEIYSAEMAIRDESNALVGIILKCFPDLKKLKLRVMTGLSVFDSKWFKPLNKLTHLDLDGIIYTVI